MAKKLLALGKWVAGPKHLWLATTVVALALTIAFGDGASEPKIRLAGLGLQFFGILTVVWGIAETRKLYGLPPILSRVKAYFDSFPLRRRSVVLAAGSASMGIATAKGRGYVTHGPGEIPTVESRLAAAEKNIAGLHDRISGVEREVDTEFRKAADDLRNEAGRRESEDRSIRERLESTSTGGIHISAIGTCWLLIGVSMSTASVELSRWFG